MERSGIEPANWAGPQPDRRMPERGVRGQVMRRTDNTDEVEGVDPLPERGARSGPTSRPTVPRLPAFILVSALAMALVEILIMARARVYSGQGESA